MTPETWNALAALVERYGLPLAILGGFLWLLLRGKLVTGGQLTQLKDELDSYKALYERERTDRIAAEAIVSKFAAANAEVADAVAKLAETVRPDPYVERLEGRRGR